jgi:hypothetical protein
MATEEERANLCERLCALRDVLVGRLVKHIDGGDIALLGSVGAALATLDAMPIEAAAAPAAEPTHARNVGPLPERLRRRTAHQARPGAGGTQRTA